MLERKNRLTKKKDFDFVFKNGRSSFDAVLGVKAVKNELTCNRLGIIVSTKVSKLAVARNRLKRQLRAAIHQELNRLEVSHDIIVVALPPILGLASAEVEASLKRNLERLRLYKTL